MKNVTLASALALFLIFLIPQATAAVYLPSASIETYGVTGAKEGTPVNLYAKVKNTGDMDLPGSSTCSVRFWIIGEGLNEQIGSVGCDLAAGKEKAYKVSWTPPNAGIYTYYVAVELTDAYGHKSLLTKWSYKKFTVSKKAVASASLVSFSVSGEGVVGGSLYSKAVVRNGGGVFLGEGCRVRFWVSGGGVSKSLGERSCGLGVGGSGSFSSGSFVPGVAGVYRFYVSVDYLSGGERVFLVPWESKEITIKENFPSASIETYGVTGAKEGTLVNLYAKVKNTGDMDLPGSSTCSVRFWIIGEGLNEQIGSVGCDLAAGKEKVYKVSWTPTKAGTYKYYAAVEFTDAYGYKTLLTKWSYKEFTVSKKVVASASLVSFSVSGDGVVGGSLYSKAVVRNGGGVFLGEGCRVRFWVLGGGVSKSLGERSCGLGVGGSGSFSGDSFVPGVAGVYRFYVSVDYLSDGTRVYLVPWKSDEITIDKKAVVNIKLYNVEDAVAGSKVYMKAQVKNTGEVDLSSRCYVRFNVTGESLNEEFDPKPCLLPIGDDRTYGVEWIPEDAGDYAYHVSVECAPSGGKVQHAGSAGMTFKVSSKPEDVSWHVSGEFKTAKWESYPLQIWGQKASEDVTYYAKLDGTSDDTYHAYSKYCSSDGEYRDYPDTWDMERRYISSGRYRITVKGSSAPDCSTGQPRNTGRIVVNPESGWKITSVNKCAVSSDKYSSNNVLILSWCNVDKETGVISWQAGSTCDGCCPCGDGALVDIDLTVEKA